MKDALGHGSNGRGGRNAKPIPNHAYHKKTDAELRYIQRDASEAGKNAQEMGDERGVNKYADQVNDAATVMGYRARTGASPDTPEPSNAAAARALASGPKSAPVAVHDGASGRADNTAEREDVAVRQQARNAPWQVYGKKTGRVYAEYPDKGKGYDKAKIHASEHNRGAR